MPRLPPNLVKIERTSLAVRLLPAYDQCMKASHQFNLLDARGVISGMLTPQSAQASFRENSVFSAMRGSSGRASVRSLSVRAEVCS